ELELVRLRLLPGARDDADGLAGRQQAVHARRGDADALLAAALAELVELAAVEKLPEDPGDLLADDAGAVVLDAHAEAVVDVLADWEDLDRDLGQDPGLLAGVERVVDRFLD